MDNGPFAPAPKIEESQRLADLRVKAGEAYQEWLSAAQKETVLREQHNLAVWEKDVAHKAWQKAETAAFQRPR